MKTLLYRYVAVGKDSLQWLEDAGIIRRCYEASPT